MKSILFRLDYGENFGGGHLSRCLILAKELQKKYKIILSIQLKDKKNIYSCKKLIKKDLGKKVKIFFLKDLKIKNEIRLISILNVRYKFDKIIFDFSNYEKAKFRLDLVAYFNELKKVNKNLILIDSLGQEALTNKLKLNISMLITPYFGAKKNNLYETHYYGSDYFVMKVKNKKKKFIKRKVENILISFGQSDHKRITYKVLKLLSTDSIFLRNIKINLIIGNDFQKNYLRKLIIFKKKNLKNFNLSFIKNCFDLSKYISASDISLISTGLTKYECLFYKSVPIIISFDHLSDKLQKKFQLYKSSIYLGQIKHLNKKKLTYNIRNLIKKYSLRKRILTNGLKIFDGKGTKRVIKVLTYEQK